MRDFIRGLVCIQYGLNAIFSKELRNYVIVPLVINIIIFGGLLWWGMDYSIQKIDFLYNNFIHLPNWLSWLNILFDILKYLIIFVLFILSFAIFSLLSTVGANLLACPFNSLLSEKSSKTLGFEIKNKNVFHSIRDSIGRELRKLIYSAPKFILVGIVCLILYFIPPFNLLIPIILYGFNGYFMAIQYIDYPAENADLKFNDFIVLMNNKRSVAIGFGLSVAVLSSIPFINFIIMPAAVIAATKLWHEYSG